MSKRWLIAVNREKTIRLREQWLRVIPGQLAGVKAYEEWLQRTKRKVDEDVEKAMKAVDDK